jgi:DNA-binding MarR family transcriptional regulator
LTPARSFSSLGVINVSRSINRSLLTTKLIYFASGLTSTEKAVLLAIAEHLGDKKLAWPSYSTIAHYAGIDRSTAYRTIAKLKERKLLRVIEAGGGDSSNRYEIDTRALARLITVKKYQKRAMQYLQRLGIKQENTPYEGVPLRGGSNEQAPSCRTQPEVVAGRNQGSCTVQPERPTQPPSGTSPSPLRPRPQPEGGDLRSGRGGMTQRRQTQVPSPAGSRLPASEGEAQLSDYIKHPQLSETFANVEVIKLADNGNPMVKSTRHPASVAASVVKLMIEVKQEGGRYPTPLEIVAATNDESFRGLRQLSWGLLTSSRQRGIVKELLLSRIRTAPPQVENAGSAHDRWLDEQKRDTLMQGHWCDADPGGDDDPNLKTFLSELD